MCIETHIRCTQRFSSVVILPESIFGGVWEDCYRAGCFIGDDSYPEALSVHNPGRHRCEVLLGDSVQRLRPARGSLGVRPAGNFVGANTAAVWRRSEPRRDPEWELHREALRPRSRSFFRWVAEAVRRWEGFSRERRFYSKRRWIRRVSAENNAGRRPLREAAGVLEGVRQQDGVPRCIEEAEHNAAAPVSGPEDADNELPREPNKTVRDKPAANIPGRRDQGRQI